MVPVPTCPPSPYPPPLFFPLTPQKVSIGATLSTCQNGCSCHIAHPLILHATVRALRPSLSLSPPHYQISLPEEFILTLLDKVEWPTHLPTYYHNYGHLLNLPAYYYRQPRSLASTVPHTLGLSSHFSSILPGDCLVLPVAACDWKETSVSTPVHWYLA